MFIYLIRLRPIGTIYTSHFHLPPPQKSKFSPKFPWLEVENDHVLRFWPAEERWIIDLEAGPVEAIGRGGFLVNIFL